MREVRKGSTENFSSTLAVQKNLAEDWRYTKTEHPSSEDNGRGVKDRTHVQSRGRAAVNRLVIILGFV